ncbi:cytochrome b [Parasphingopyxis sp.]|uniref:cytochrome b n=1 Tax=Parasphingopyxis sp. TaxID=1920299 RepID=UPI00260A1386|nr:cytochrome b [Parasphingopyxis sp.]
MTRYTNIAIALHWIIALLVMVNIAIAIGSEDLSREARGPCMDAHKAIGITIFLLAAARIGWWFRHRPPALPDTMARWQRAIAKGTHFLFYALMLGLPLSGWLWMSTYPAPFSWFGLVDVPMLPVVGQEGLGELLHEAHEIMGKAMIALVALHLLAALKHLLVDDDDLMHRMLPGDSS